MSRLLFLSIISVAAGCSSPHPNADAPADDCGPGSAPADGLTATGTGFAFTYEALMASANNDCPDPAAPQGVVSLTIEGSTADGTGLFTICVERPDHLGPSALALGTDVQVVDVTGSAGGCDYGIDPLATPTGSVTATGVCANGTDPAGFALTVTGSVGMRQTCGATVTPVIGALAGTTAVGAM